MARAAPAPTPVEELPDTVRTPRAARSADWVMAVEGQHDIPPPTPGIKRAHDSGEMGRVSEEEPRAIDRRPANCTGAKFSYKGAVAIGWHCTLDRLHKGPCAWERDEEPAPSANGSGTYPALARR